MTTLSFIAVKMVETKGSFEARLPRRHADLEDLVSNLSVEELRALVVPIAIRSPSLVFDIMDSTEIANNGDPYHERHHPPEWVVSLRQLPSQAIAVSVAEQLCCKMQPRHCLSQRAELEMLLIWHTTKLLQRHHNIVAHK